MHLVGMDRTLVVYKEEGEVRGAVGGSVGISIKGYNCRVCYYLGWSVRSLSFCIRS